MGVLFCDGSAARRRGIARVFEPLSFADPVFASFPPPTARVQPVPLSRGPPDQVKTFQEKEKKTRAKSRASQPPIIQVRQSSFSLVMVSYSSIFSQPFD